MNIHQFKSAYDLYHHLIAGKVVFGIKRGGKQYDISDVVSLVSVRDMDRAAVIALNDESEAGKQLARAVRARCRELAEEYFTEIVK